MILVHERDRRDERHAGDRVIRRAAEDVVGGFDVEELVVVKLAVGGGVRHVREALHVFCQRFEWRGIRVYGCIPGARVKRLTSGAPVP